MSTRSGSQTPTLQSQSGQKSKSEADGKSLADQFEPAESLISWYGNQKSRDGRSICYLRTKSEVDTHNAAARFHNESFHQPPSLDNTAAWLVYGRNLKSLVDLASQQAKQGQSSLVSMSKVTKIPVAIPTEETYFDYQKTLVKLELALEKITFKIPGSK